MITDVKVQKISVYQMGRFEMVNNLSKRRPNGHCWLLSASDCWMSGSAGWAMAYKSKSMAQEAKGKLKAFFQKHRNLPGHVSAPNEDWGGKPLLNINGCPAVAR